MLKNSFLKANGFYKSPKIWNSWVPRVREFSYDLFYMPKNSRKFVRDSEFLIKISYKNFGNYLFFVPNTVYMSIIKFGRQLVGSSFSKTTRNRLKPFISSILVTLLGVTFRFKIFLKVKGLGYKAYVYNNGKKLSLKLGLSHIVNFFFTDNMFAESHGTKDRMFSVEGNDWIVLTNTVARIKNLRRIDYYRGKGIFQKFNNCKIRESRKKK